MEKNDLILVTGATGKQGGAIAHELLSRGYAVRAMTRNPDGEAAERLEEQGAEVVFGDFDDADSLVRALDGVWGALAVQNTWEVGVEREEEQGKKFAVIAESAGIYHFVYQSVGSAHRNTGIPHFENKWRVEETIRSLGFPSYTIIRPVFFMENLVSPWYKAGIDANKLTIAIRPDTRLQMIAVDDIGKYGAMAFERHEELNGQAIDIAGDELTAPEAARILSDASGRNISYYRVPIEEVRASSEDFAAMLEWFDEVGYNVNIEENARKYSIKPTRFGEWAALQDWRVSSVA